MQQHANNIQVNETRSVAGGLSGASNRKTVQKKENTTGLDDNLKSGIESISGHSLDDVKVHYNSSQPAQLNALAYARGTDIHVGAGQEKHVAHEAWHVVQQKEGRVNPTKQLGNTPVNDDVKLEKEADQMGNKALQYKKAPAANAVSRPLPSHSQVSQLVVTKNETTQQWESDVTGMSYATKEEAEKAEAMLLSDELWPAIKYKMLEYAAAALRENNNVADERQIDEDESIDDNRIFQQYVEEASYNDTANEEGAKLVLDRKDAHGLAMMAHKIGYRIKKKAPGAILLVAGASPEILAALIAEFFPDIKQVTVSMSDVEEKHAQGVPDPKVIAYVRNSMGKYAVSGQPVVILDATDMGSSIILLKKVLLQLDPSRKVIPLSINAIDDKLAFGEKIHALKTDVENLPINKAKSRFNYQIYKGIFPRLVGKLPISRIIDGTIESTPAPGEKEQEEIRIAAKALLRVWATKPLDEEDFDNMLVPDIRAKEKREALSNKRKEAMKAKK